MFLDKLHNPPCEKGLSTAYFTLRSIYFDFFGKELRVDISRIGERPQNYAGLFLPRSGNLALCQQSMDVMRIDAELREKETRLATLKKLELEKKTIVSTLAGDAEKYQENIAHLAKEQQESEAKLLQLSQKIARMQEQDSAFRKRTFEYVEAAGTREERVQKLRPYGDCFTPDNPYATVQRNLSAQAKEYPEASPRQSQESEESVDSLSSNDSQQPEELDQTSKPAARQNMQYTEAGRKPQQPTRTEATEFYRGSRINSNRQQKIYNRQGSPPAPSNPSHRITQLNFERSPAVTQGLQEPNSQAEVTSLSLLTLRKLILILAQKFTN
jgi:hypothetical protein